MKRVYDFYKVLVAGALILQFCCENTLKSPSEPEGEKLSITGIRGTLKNDTLTGITIYGCGFTKEVFAEFDGDESICEFQSNTQVFLSLGHDCIEGTYSLLVICGEESVEEHVVVVSSSRQDGLIWKGNSTSAPENPEVDLVYLNTVSNSLFVYDGDNWFFLVEGGVSDCADSSVSEDTIGEYITLTRLSEEPVGNNCEEGGQKIESGEDLNGNGQLEDNEITDIAYECGKTDVWYGDFMVSDSVSMNQISGYMEVTGNLTVSGNGNNFTLDDLKFLRVLTTVGGDLELSYNQTLLNLTGLNSLSSVSGSLIIATNDSLENLEGAEALSFIGGNLSIAGNKSLKSVSGLKNLTEIGRSLTVMNNNTLKNLNGLATIIATGSYLLIKDNAALLNVDGLNSLISVGGGITLSGNSLLAAIEGMNSLKSVQGDISIYQNNSLERVSGFNKVSSVEMLGFYKNKALNVLNGFNSLESVNVSMHIDFNDSLKTIGGFNELNSINILQISGNGSLTDIDGLEELRYVVDDVSIIMNSQLPTCRIQEVVDNLSDFTGTVTIEGNDDTATCD